MSQTLPAPSLLSSGKLNSFAGWIVLGACLVATTLAWRDVEHSQLQNEQAYFNSYAANTCLRIEHALSMYEQGLYIAAADIANQARAHAELRDVVIPHLPRQTTPDIQEIAFTPTTYSDKATGAAVAAIDHPPIKAVRIATRYSAADAAALPDELRPDRLFTTAHRLSHHGRTNGEESVQQNALPEVTMLMYLPAYADENQRGHGRLAGKLLGYVYARIPVGDFIEPLRANADDSIRIKFFEGIDPGSGSLLYDSHLARRGTPPRVDSAKFSKAALINVGSNHWTIQFEAATSGLPSSSGNRAGAYILVGGLLLAFSLFSVTHARMRHRQAGQIGLKQQEWKNQIDALEARRDQEQKRLAQEMHDDLGQLLAAMKMDLAGLSRHVPSDDVKASRCLNSINELVNAMMTSVRRIISDLPPQALEDHGLFDALRSMANRFEERHQVKCRIYLPPAEPRMEQRTTSAIYRMTQESLNNVAKHACATAVEIRMELIDHCIELSISDNGKGFSARALHKAGAFGLIAMRERAASLNGSMTVESSSGAGTTISITLPLNKELHCHTEAATPPALTGGA